ncbi:MAG: hypothetical protein DRR08_32915 [Candidatus Parabeggiatoa sp. nov. 2]|nr:MAG: hypothetical protein B6247_28590 [Beggiatoa sp. 4572_84]RKZ46893.1 MAG: hypothetical protein DRR08_32915 [Gammaproteobacteria bacterium]
MTREILETTKQEFVQTKVCIPFSYRVCQINNFNKSKDQRKTNFSGFQAQVFFLKNFSIKHNSQFIIIKNLVYRVQYIF